MYIGAEQEFIQAVQKAGAGQKAAGGTVVSGTTGKSAREEKWELKKFKLEFHREVEKLQKSEKLDMLVVNVTDEGWERMMQEPEYRQEILDRIQRDTTTGFYKDSVDVIIEVGGTSGEYRASRFYMASGQVSRKIDLDSYVERRKRRKKRQKALEEYMWQKHMEEKSIIINMSRKRAGLPKGKEYIAQSMSDIMRKYNNNFLYM